ncbi:AEC family transporter [Thermoanaerobacterium thermosaccharolyticum]|uniref:Auxin efflux carrier n=2 Tax=Thermoanaerobacterium thermosaccharolyticum TaxID=1517 RepID=A0A223HVE1_THETR|nr:AEC family transporter [Thermoanaerobacterium thermosaccharolyticum]AGB18710.1 putative permease [Thermoanaerobacterium thermosaccharolyticum M0795]AST56402.1 auxin efflux carrier [Thermoanaerobacterium thermosaccharolyticum]PHO08427.1 transporter [Thermoanaerobacterium thermosaccharolyticum]
MSQIIILQKISISIIVIFLGYAVKKMKFLPSETGKVLNNFIIYITLPASIAKVFFTTKVNTNLFVLTFFGFILGVITFLIGFLIFKKTNLKKETKGTLMISLCGYNIGLFAFPFIQQIYGNNGLLHIAMFDMGNSFNVFGIAYIIAYAFSENDKLDIKKVFKKILYFIPFDTYIISFILNIVGFKFPGLIVNLVEQISLPNTTLALFVIGYFLDFNLDKDEIVSLVKGLIIKYIPGIILFITLPLFFSTTSMTIKAIMLGSIMPTALVAVIYSDERNLNVKLASIFITSTTIITIIFMSLIMLKW